MAYTLHFRGIRGSLQSLKYLFLYNVVETCTTSSNVRACKSNGVKMKISELKAGASNVTVTGTVSRKDETREVVTKYGKRLNVANITLKDDTGEIAMSLWGKDIETVDQGDTIEIANGYVSEFRGNPQLSSGKFGKINVVKKGDGSPAKKAAADDEPEDFGVDDSSEGDA
jgi:replication factor A1